MPLPLPPKHLSMIGQGKLGCPIAAALATRGFIVTGVDNDPQRVNLINQHQPPIHEPGLLELLQQAGSNFHATTDLESAVRQTQVTMILVPTPSSADGGFALDSVLAVCEKVGLALRNKAGYHLVVITSTVMPGATQGPIRQCLESASGRVVGQNLGLCYSPEFVAIGSVIRDFLHPDMLLIGQSDDHAGDLLEAIGRQAALTQPSVSRMNFVNAELAKIAVNTFVTTKITFANMLGSVCQNLPGADVDVVTQAVGMDSRIGRKYLKAAVGYGGPCFPRDNLALAALAKKTGGQSDLAQAVDAANRKHVIHLADQICAQVQAMDVGLCAKLTIGVLGLSYKPDTDVIEESQGIALVKELHWRGLPVIAHDPAACASARVVLPPQVQLFETLEQAVETADLLVIMTPWASFKALETLPRPRRSLPRLILDAWRMLDPRKLQQIDPNLTYIALGRCPLQAINSSMPLASDVAA